MPRNMYIIKGAVLFLSLSEIRERTTQGEKQGIETKTYIISFGL